MGQFKTQLKTSIVQIMILIFYLCAVLQFKLVEESPGIPQIWFDLHGPQEPLSGLGDFALAPEQPSRMHRIIRGNGRGSARLGRAGERANSGFLLCHGEQHVGIVLALLQGVNALCLPLRPGLQEHSLGPQDAWANTAEQQLCEPMVTIMIVRKCLL